MNIPITKGLINSTISDKVSEWMDGNSVEKCIIPLRETFPANDEERKRMTGNAMYIEGSPVIECSFIAARSLEDMLIQSWGDYIRIFPAVPEEWKGLAFKDLRTKGAFLVSTSRKAGQTEWVLVKSLAGEPCRIKPSIEGEISIVKNGQTVQKSLKKDEIINVMLKKGEEVLIYDGKEVPDLIIGFI